MKPAVPLHTIDATSSLQDAAETLAFYGIGALPVEEGGVLVGIVSERDLVRAIAELANFAGTPVSDYMTPGPISIDVGDSLAAAAKIMVEFQVRHVPIVERGRVVDLVSIRDVLSSSAASASSTG